MDDESRMDDEAVELIRNMREAAAEDAEMNRKKMPSLAKLRLLKRVVDSLSQALWKSTFLDAGILGPIKL